jgi:hypothetical protein
LFSDTSSGFTELTDNTDSISTTTTDSDDNWANILGPEWHGASSDTSFHNHSLFDNGLSNISDVLYLHPCGYSSSNSSSSASSSEMSDGEMGDNDFESDVEMLAGDADDEGEEDSDDEGQEGSKRRGWARLRF